MQVDRALQYKAQQAAQQGTGAPAGAPRTDPTAPPPPIYSPGTARKDTPGSNGYYDPYANDDTRTRTNMSSGFASMGEVLGTASAYRSPGYQVNRGAGLVGGNVDASNAELNGLQSLANNSRAGIDPYRAQYGAALGQYGAGLDNGMQARGIQQTAADSYMATLNGTAPSLAQLQMQQGLQQSQAAQASMAAGARGGGANLAAAQLGGAQMAAQQGAQYNQQAAQLRAQEYANAQAGLAGIGGQMRGQDYAQSGLGLQNAGLAQQGIGQQMTDAQAYQAMKQKQQLGELGAQAGLEEAQAKEATARQEQVGQQEQASAKEGSSLVGGLVGAFGSMLSDERTKTERRDASKDIDRALSKMTAETWRYKDEPKSARRIGPMAQDMPKEVVMEVGGAKVVRMDKATGLVLSGLARLAQRLDKVEGRKRR